MPRRGQRNRKDLTPAELTQAVSRLTGDSGSGGAFIERLADELGVSPRELQQYLESFGQAKRARGSLDRELIVEVALRIADEHGLEALTLRRLAAELGVTPTALVPLRREQGRAPRRDGGSRPGSCRRLGKLPMRAGKRR